MGRQLKFRSVERGKVSVFYLLFGVNSRFMKDYWGNHSESFWNVSGSFGYHLAAIYIIPAYAYRLEVSLGILENVCNSIV